MDKFQGRQQLFEQSLDMRLLKGRFSMLGVVGIDKLRQIVSTVFKNQKDATGRRYRNLQYADVGCKVAAHAFLEP